MLEAPMKTIVASAASLSALLISAVAAACPNHADAVDACSRGGSSIGGYLAAVAIGLGVGMTTVVVERRLRK
jgi:hypothetical protein